MRISTRTVVDIESGVVVSREAFNYEGPLALAISFGGNKSKQKSKSQQQSSSESGTDIDKLYKILGDLSPGRHTIKTSPGTFDAAKYLAANPDVANFKDGPYEHWIRHGQAEGRPGGPEPGDQQIGFDVPDYNPNYVRGAYTPVEGGDFNKIESNLYESQASKLKRAYDTGVAGQREELAQMGALNSPSQFLEGSARSSLDRGYLENLQQAARDASNYALGLKATEAARRTAFDTGEATRETGFNEQTASALLDAFLKKLALAIETGRYSRGTGSGESSSSGDSSGFNFGLMKFGTAS